MVLDDTIGRNFMLVTLKGQRVEPYFYSFATSKTYFVTKKIYSILVRQGKNYNNNKKGNNKDD